MKGNRWQTGLIFTIIMGMQVVLAFSSDTYASERFSSYSAEPLWWWDKDEEERPDDKLPPLKGGPEEDHRQQTPLALQELQQLYPDTAFLQGPTTVNRVALTFDDGPDPRFTPGVLDVLNEYNVPATFFLTGARAEAEQELAKRIAGEGHVIGNHTYSHPNLVEEESVDILIDEVTRTEDALERIIGYRTTLFRPPYGFLYGELVEALADLNYSVIGWSIDTLDWQELPPEEITDTVLNNIQPGAIILMHDGTADNGDQTATIESLREIIPSLQGQGFEFVTVPELLNIPYQR